MPRPRLPIAMLALVLALLIVTPGLAAARVPQGFVGMNGGDALFTPGVSLSRQLDTMVSSGVESLRATFNWALAQPNPGVPASFAATDQIVGIAAQRGLQVLPVVTYVPGWDSVAHGPTTYGRPASNAPYASYVSALVRRYGPHGSYWNAHPSIRRMPIRMWQIWNEPDIVTFWPTRPWQHSYVALLRAAHAAIKSIDPGAKVVLAGLPNYSWLYLKSIYKVQGARGAFDIVAVHPYTAQPDGVITILQRIRGVMNSFGDVHKQILASEVGWPSSKGKAPQSFGTTEAGQARNTSAVLPLLASHRQQLGLLGFDYYSWIGNEFPGARDFNYSGLFRFDASSGIAAKPAFAAFRSGALALESCRQKSHLATRCSKAVTARRRHKP